MMMNTYPELPKTGLLSACALAALHLLAAVSAVAVVPQIDPILDTGRLITDPESLAQYQQIMLSAPDFETMVPDAGDFAQIVYIDPSVAVSGSGASPASPLKSWTQVTFTSGTAYLQKCGTQETIPGRFGNPPGNILFGAYGEGPRPILSTSETETGDRALFQLFKSGYVIRDLHIRAPHIAACIRLSAATDAIVYNNELEDSIWGIRAFSAGAVVNYKILRNIIHSIADDGMFVQDVHSIEIGWNFIFRVNTNWVEPYTPQTVAGGDSVQLHMVTNWHVHHNVLDRSDSGNKFAFICNEGSDPGLFEHNFAIGPKTTGDGGAAVYLGSGQSNYVLRYNTFVRSGTGVLYHFVNNILVYGNIFTRNPSGNVANANGVGNARYYHNVFWNNGGPLIVNGGVLANNIFDNSSGGFSGITYREYNLFTNPVSGLSATNIVAAPEFVDPDNGDFRLQSGSPAIDAGMILIGFPFTEDRGGTPVPQGDAPDMGAWEFTPGLTPFQLWAGDPDPDPNSDSDLDGLLLLLEYALDLSPSGSDGAESLPSLDILPNGALRLTFHRDIAKTDILYIVESSINLASWTEIFGAANADTPNNSGDEHAVVGPVTSGSRFLRLRIELLPQE